MSWYSSSLGETKVELWKIGSHHGTVDALLASVDEAGLNIHEVIPLAVNAGNHEGCPYMKRQPMNDSRCGLSFCVHLRIADYRANWESSRSYSRMKSRRPLSRL